MDEGENQIVRKHLKHRTHALIVGRGDGDQIEFREHENELSAGTSALFAAVSFAFDFDIFTPPEISVVRLSVGIRDGAGRSLDKLSGNKLLVLPFAFVHHQHPHLQHVARSDAGASGRLGQTADVILPVIAADAYAAPQFIANEVFGAAGHNGLKNLHRDGGI